MYQDTRWPTSVGCQGRTNEKTAWIAGHNDVEKSRTRMPRMGCCWNWPEKAVIGCLYPCWNTSQVWRRKKVSKWQALPQPYLSNFAFFRCCATLDALHHTGLGQHFNTIPMSQSCRHDQKHYPCFTQFKAFWLKWTGKELHAHWGQKGELGESWARETSVWPWSTFQTPKAN